MLNIKRQTVINQNNEIISVIIDYNDYLHIEEMFENYGLAKLIDEVDPNDYLDKKDAVKYYPSLKGVEVDS